MGLCLLSEWSMLSLFLIFIETFIQIQRILEAALIHRVQFTQCAFNWQDEKKIATQIYVSLCKELVGEAEVYFWWLFYNSYIAMFWKRYIISLTIGTKMLHAKHPSCHRTETWTGMHLPNMGLTNFGVKIWMKYGCVCVNNKDITITRSNHLLNGSQRWSFDESALKPDDFILFEWMLGIKPLSLLDR